MSIGGFKVYHMLPMSTIFFRILFPPLKVIFPFKFVLTVSKGTYMYTDGFRKKLHLSICIPFQRLCCCKPEFTYLYPLVVILNINNTLASVPLVSRTYVLDSWIYYYLLFQIFQFSHKVKLAAAGYNNNTHHLHYLPQPFPSYWMNELPNK